MQREARRAVRELGVAHHLLGVLGEAVHPVIPDAVRELLLLAPKHLRGEVRVVGGVERLAQQVLLQERVAVLVLLRDVDHLLRGVGVHGVVAHRLRQKRRAHLDAPRHRALVGAQHVPLVQPRGLTLALLVELLLGGRLVEVQVPAEQLVRALTGQNHLEPHALDPAAQQVHGHRRAHLLERLEVVHHVGQRVQSFFRREVDLVVHGAQLVSHLLRRREVGRALDADAERVHRLGRAERVGGLRLVPHGDGGDEARVQPARQQNGVRDIRHEAVLHGVDHCFSQFSQVGLTRGDVVIVNHPLRVVPARERALRLARLSDVVVPGGKDLVSRDSGVVHQRLHLAGEPHGPILAVRDVARDLTHVVSAGDDRAVALVLDDVREHPIELAHEFGAQLFVQVADDLAVALVRADDAVLLAERLVVVNLAVADEGGELRLGVDVQRLVPVRPGRDDGQPLVHHEGLRAVRLIHGDVHVVGIRPAMADALGQVVHALAVTLGVAGEADDGEDAAHRPLTFLTSRSVRDSRLCVARACGARLVLLQFRDERTGSGERRARVSLTGRGAAPTGARAVRASRGHETKTPPAMTRTRADAARAVVRLGVGRRDAAVRLSRDCRRRVACCTQSIVTTRASAGPRGDSEPVRGGEDTR